VDPNEMTPDERAAVLADIQAQQPVRMIRPDGREVFVAGDRVAERLAAGYTRADEAGRDEQEQQTDRPGCLSRAPGPRVGRIDGHPAGTKPGGPPNHESETP
jgi:hypothetical protein